MCGLITLKLLLYFFYKISHDLGHWCVEHVAGGWMIPPICHKVSLPLLAQAHFHQLLPSNSFMQPKHFQRALHIHKT